MLYTSALRRFCSRDCQRSFWRDSPDYRNDRVGKERHRKTGWTPDEYNAAYELQGGLCAICESPCSSGDKLAADHNHKTGAKRALLCGKCNRAIGYFNDNVRLLQRALEYVDNYEGQPPG